MLCETVAVHLRMRCSHCLRGTLLCIPVGTHTPTRTHIHTGWASPPCVSVLLAVTLCRVRNIYEALERMEQRVLLVVPVFATVSQGLLFLLVCSTFFLASFVDPGIYPRGKPALDTPTHASTAITMAPGWLAG